MPRKKMQTEEDAAAARMGDFGSAITQICDEKGISKDKVIETVEAALAAAYKKDYGKRGQNIRAEFDEVSGGTKFYLVKEVVDETTREFVEEEEKNDTGEGNKEDNKGNSKEGAGKPAFADNRRPEPVASNEAMAGDEEKLPRYNPERDLSLEDAREIKKDAAVGDIIETELEQKSEYGRVAAQTAKQVIIQRIREAERDSMYDEYKNREGEVINGTVQRIEGRNIFIDLGKSIGVLFPSEQVERESYRVGQRLKVYLLKVDAGTKGPGITLSRIHPEMIKKMFELEVPEIFAGTVEIKSIAREAGERTKIAVASTEEGVDPIGSCVGQKGTRVQAVIDELGGEKIDIIQWNDDTSKFISASLSPAKVLRVDVNEATKEAVAIVPEDQLSLAIGKRGQNVRLAAKLTGWKIDINGAENKAEPASSAGDEKENDTEDIVEEKAETETSKEIESEKENEE